MTFEFSGDLLDRESDKPFGELNINENTVIVIEVVHHLFLINFFLV